MHKPVLLHESIDALDLGPEKIFLDGTFGAGGHSREALRRFPTMRVIGLDQDPAVTPDQEFRNSNFEFKTGNFRNIGKLLGGVTPDAILLDIGFSSDQLEASGRGFSFLKDEPLDMRMSQSGLTASEILNSWDESAIGLILHGFGEEKFSDRIAKEIVRRREMKPFETTTELLEAINSAVPAFYKRGRIHPATRTFQALRIAVNEELTALEEGLEKAWEALAENGRLAVITFHSLEDRIVKNFFRDRAKDGTGVLVNKKPTTASEEELIENPRARSAKLRTIKKL